MDIKFPEPVTLTAAQAMEHMDKIAERVMGISGADFLAAWDAGVYRSEDTAEVAELAALIPFVR